MVAAGDTPFSALCKAIYQRNCPFASQAQFVTELIKATGASANGISNASATKIYRGERRLNVNFPHNLDKERLISFFQSCIEIGEMTDEQRDNRCAEIANNLESPIKGVINRDRFYRALALYISDIVHPNRQLRYFADYYISDLNAKDRPDQDELKPLHKDDHVTNFSAGNNNPIKLQTYESSPYIFKLMNDGTIDWNERTLHCTNPKDDLLRPDKNDVKVTYTAPSLSRPIEIPLTLRAQHMEGEACSRWVMLDNHGTNCFPNNPDLFNIKATIVFIADEETNND